MGEKITILSGETKKIKICGESDENIVFKEKTSSKNKSFTKMFYRELELGCKNQTLFGYNKLGEKYIVEGTIGCEKQPPSCDITSVSNFYVYRPLYTLPNLLVGETATF